MRIIGEIAHDQCKITLYHWNNRYIIKLERNYLEQTFKVDQFELGSEKELNMLVGDAFIQKAIDRFNDMEQCLAEGLERL
jgi:hypothetical protein